MLVYTRLVSSLFIHPWQKIDGFCSLDKSDEQSDERDAIRRERRKERQRTGGRKQ